MKLFLIILTLTFSLGAIAAPPKSSIKSKFYDFGEYVINGKIRSPTSLYVNARERAKFKRLLSLKKSFMNRLFNTHKEKVFK